MPASISALEICDYALVFLMVSATASWKCVKIYLLKFE